MGLSGAVRRDSSFLLFIYLTLSGFRIRVVIEMYTDVILLRYSYTIAPYQGKHGFYLS